MYDDDELVGRLPYCSIINSYGNRISFWSEEEWIEYNYPWEWRDSLCMSREHSGNFGEVETVMFGEVAVKVCKKCKKACRWQLIRNCRSCGSFYFQQFKHKDRDYNKLECYSCLTVRCGEDPNGQEPPIKPKAIRTMAEIIADDDPFGDDLNFSL